MHYHVGELVTSMVRTQLVPGGTDALLYATVMGGIGALIPFSSREDVDFFTALEIAIRAESTTLCGRDQQSFR
jgi:splicing factor 3B subunit 3